MMTLAYKKYQMNENFMMELMVEAFPIIFYQKHLEDGSRKIMEVIEGLGYENGKVNYHTLYEFRVTDTLKDENGKVTEIVGKHVKVGNPSIQLQERLIDNGVSHQELQKFLDIPIGAECA